MRKINLRDFQVATSLTARDINRRIILNVIRLKQPLSRADVARLTGLQRSTVSLIADQLIEEGWIVEGAFGRLPRGRRPIFLQLNTDHARILGVNVRPSQTTLAVADLNGLFLAQETIATDEDPKEFVRNLAAQVKALIKRHPGVTFEGIGVSLPGRVNTETDRLVTAPNLGWRDIDFKTPLEKATRLPVEVENAANACALAETYFGQHAQEIDNLIAVTVSEGIGTGIIANGQLVRGMAGMAGEFGHVSLDPQGPPCKCGGRGCWEALASNAAAVRDYTKAVGSGGNGSKGHKGSGATVSFDDVLRLAETGDKRAGDVLDEMARQLGAGLAMLATGFAPDLIAVVGEVTRAWDRVGPIIAKTVQERTHCMLGIETRIAPVDETNQPRLRGTVALVLEKHFGAPRVA